MSPGLFLDLDVATVIDADGVIAKRHPADFNRLIGAHVSAKIHAGSGQLDLAVAGHRIIGIIDLDRAGNGGAWILKRGDVNRGFAGPDGFDEVFGIGNRGDGRDRGVVGKGPRRGGPWRTVLAVISGTSEPEKLQKVSPYDAIRPRNYDLLPSRAIMPRFHKSANDFSKISFAMPRQPGDGKTQAPSGLSGPRTSCLIPTTHNTKSFTSYSCPLPSSGGSPHRRPWPFSSIPRPAPLWPL